MAAVALVVSAAVLPYLNALDNGFVWDDDMLIVQNQRVRSLSFSGDSLLRDFFQGAEADVGKYGYFRPLVTLSYMVDYRLWGLDPFGFHLTNVVLHAIASLLVLLLATRLVPEHPEAALVSALLFAVHPVHTESVAWIAGRTDVIATVLTLSSLLTALAAFRRPIRIGWLSVSLAAATAALFAKESVLVLPALVGVFLLLYRREWSIRERAGVVALYLVPVGAYLWVRFAVARVAAGATAPWTPWEWALSFLATVWLYLRRLLLPIELCAYITNPISTSLLDPRVLAGGAATAVLVALACRSWRDRPGLAFAVSWWWITLLPVANIIRVTSPADMGFTAAERFLYAPSVGLLIAVVLWVAQHLRSRFLRMASASAGVLVLATLTVLRNPVWLDDPTLFSDALRSSPDAPLLWNNLGRHWLDAGDGEQARRCFERVVELQGPGSRILVNLAAAARLGGDPARALTLLDQAEAIEPDLAAIAYNRGLCQLALGDLDAAVDSLREATSRAPDNPRALGDLATAYGRAGRLDQARTTLVEALRVDPTSSALWANLGVVDRQLGRLDDARRALERAVQLDPERSTVRGNLGVVLAQLGRREAAEVHLVAAIELDPTNLDAANAYGVLLAVTNRGSEAERVFRELAHDHPGDPEAYLNLGLLARQMGETRAAEGWFREALRVDPGNLRAATYLEAAAPGSGGR